MNPEEREHSAEREPSEREPADRWLDDALDRYQAIPPRPGLETRILAHLQAHAGRRRSWWFFASAAVATAVLCAVLAMTVLNSKRHVVQPSAAVQTANPAKAVTVQPEPASVWQVQERRAAVNKGRTRNVDGSQARLLVADVKQDIFPAPSPPSEQKMLLQAYLGQTPKQELNLVAERQRSASAIPDLTIEPIEIKELAPIKDMDLKGNL